MVVVDNTFADDQYELSLTMVRLKFSVSTAYFLINYQKINKDKEFIS